MIRLRWVAYVAIVMASFWGFWRQQDTINDLERESKARQEAVCASGIEGRRILRGMIDYSAPPDSTNERVIAFRKYVIQLGLYDPPPTCEEE